MVDVPLQDAEYRFFNDQINGGAEAKVSVLNSTTAVLAANAVFTGTSENAVLYGSVTISGIASHASATNGLTIQQSADGTNWDFTDSYSVSAGVSFKLNVPRQAAYFRIVYTNGATLQTSFRLQVIFNPSLTRPVSVKPADSTTIENDMDETLSVNMTYNGTSLDIGRSSINGTNSTGTGVTASGMLAQFDDVSPTAMTENQFGNLRMASDHSLLVSVQNSYNHISTAATTTIKSGAGTLKCITVNSLGTVASTTTVYDNTTATGTIIAVINTLALSGTFNFDVQFTTGLTIVTTGTIAPDITVSYK